MRKIIRSVAPMAEEVISYGIPSYKLGGYLVGFAGWKTHIGFYPFSGSFLQNFKKEFKGYSVAKGTLRFPLNKPPAACPNKKAG